MSSRTADFAGVLDGVALWLAVPGEGALALVTQDGVRVPVETEQRDGFATCCVDLRALPAAPSYAVWLGEAPVLAPPAVEGPTRTPQAWPVCFDVETADDGTLRVVRDEPDPVAMVEAAALDGDALVITVDGGTELLLVEPGQGVRARLPLDATGTARIRDEDVPAEPGLVVRLVAERDGVRRPLRRARHDLADPDGATVLPQLDRDGEPSLVLKWQPNGALRLRRLGGAS